ncbi:K+-transporting ATPase [Brasilonema octagenarum UFV-E1]|uniref:K+-transporting ATPase n=1 Tax=Brasilonema sennae CENA114 TaxID=415709 RepID=A0A856MD73_9CYAN|nr:K+-transporting ATPase [Brasilonema sennae CENA114]QDL14616.1 K+-transporting ATPase [Brasilonema octagenarum UFV-E1]
MRRFLLSGCDTRSVKPLAYRSLGASRSQKLPLAIFVALCLNLLIAPIVYAADSTLERFSGWAIGVLGLVTLAIIIYLSIVVFQPERF